MFDEAIFTLEEVSQHLRVPIELLNQEIASGTLRAMNFGGLIRVSESDLTGYKQAAKSVPVLDSSRVQKPGSISLELQPTPDFAHRWPDGTSENFKNAREGVARHDGKDYRVKLGFAVRDAAGKSRSRGLVLIDRYPTVEFVGANAEIGNGERMASIVKDRHNKHLPVGGKIPLEYEGFTLGSYRDVVVGPGAANGLAVICESEDFETMVRHALIRHSYRQERN
jgi:excisionase family DNA binding protein